MCLILNGVICLNLNQIIDNAKLIINNGKIDNGKCGKRSLKLNLHQLPIFLKAKNSLQ
jgi:hypothetical protein